MSKAGSQVVSAAVGAWVSGRSFFRKLWPGGRKRREPSFDGRAQRALRSQVEPGEVLGVSATAVEITEQMRVEEALRQSERRYRTLTEAVVQLMWANDADGQHRVREPAVGRLLGPEPRRRLEDGLAQAGVSR